MNAAPATTWIDHIPAIWLEPLAPQPSRRLVIFLSGLSGNKESLLPYLTDALAEGAGLRLSLAIVPVALALQAVLFEATARGRAPTAP